MFDLVNPLSDAVFNQYIGSSFNTSSNIDFSVNGITCDFNGNILTMNLLGLKPNVTIFLVIDQINYGYVSVTNKLQSVIDLGNDLADINPKLEGQLLYWCLKNL